MRGFNDTHESIPEVFKDAYEKHVIVHGNEHHTPETWLSLHQARIRLLVDALRSGDYKRTERALCYRSLTDLEGFSYCPLGVGCDVFHKVTGLGEWTINNKEFPEFTLDDRAYGDDLPPQVAHWYGFADTNPTLSPELVSVISANDSLGLELDEMATAIEDLYLKV